MTYNSNPVIGIEAVSWCNFVLFSIAFWSASFGLMFIFWWFFDKPKRKLTVTTEKVNDVRGSS
jgi:hypothetical protein